MASTARQWVRRPMAALLIAALGWPSTAGATSRAAPEAEAPTIEPEPTAKPETTEPTAEPDAAAGPEATAEPSTTPASRVEPTPQDLAPSDLRFEQAALHWQEGKRLYDNGRYADAAVEFDRSYAAVPAAATLYSVALSYERAGKPVEAVRAFRRYLELPDCAELPPGEPTYGCTAQRPEAEQALEELRPRVGELALSLGEGVKLREVRVAGRTVPLDDFPLLLLPGTVDVEVFGLGPDERRTRPVTIIGGDVATFYVAPFEEPEGVVVPPKPDPEPDDDVDEVRLERRRRGLKTSFWIGTGLTAASGIAMAVMGGLTLYHRNEFRRDLCARVCEDPDAPPYPEDHELEFERYKPVTNALVGVTVGLAVATALVGTFAFRKRAGEAEAGVRARVRPSARPVVRMGASGLVVRW